MNLSEFYGTDVHSLDCKQRGTVLGVRLNGNKIVCLRCCDAEEREFLLEPADVCRLGGDAIVYRSVKKTSSRQSLRAPYGEVSLGAAAYSEQGKYLGRLHDAECDGYTVTHATVGERQYRATRLVFGDAIIVKAGKRCAVPPIVCLDKKKKSKKNASESDRTERLSEMAKDLFIRAVCEP